MSDNKRKQLEILPLLEEIKSPMVNTVLATVLRQMTEYSENEYIWDENFTIKETVSELLDYLEKNK